jgi:hypothetical protein
MRFFNIPYILFRLLDLYSHVKSILELFTVIQTLKRVTEIPPPACCLTIDNDPLESADSLKPGDLSELSGLVPSDLTLVRAV